MAELNQIKWNELSVIYWDFEESPDAGELQRAVNKLVEKGKTPHFAYADYEGDTYVLVVSGEELNGQEAAEVLEYLDIFDYLDDLRESGETNMFGATPYIVENFDISHDKAKEILLLWMKNFSERHPG
jgi:hypothetical protein